MDWGIAHPLYMLRILNEEAKFLGLPPLSFDFKKALIDLDLCDYILVPSRFVYTTFLEHDYDVNKLRIVKYGVSSNDFKANKSEIMIEKNRLYCDDWNAWTSKRFDLSTQSC